MVVEESLNQCIERLLALPPRQRLEAFRAIQDQTFRREVIRGLPGQIYTEILGESMTENLNRNIQARLAQTKLPQTKPSQAA